MGNGDLAGELSLDTESLDLEEPISELDRLPRVKLELITFEETGVVFSLEEVASYGSVAARYAADGR